MNEDSRPSNFQQRNWLDKIRQIFFNDPKSRTEILNQLRDIESSEPVDSNVLHIIEGALQVSDMQVRDIMIPRSKMTCVKSTQILEEFLPVMIEASHSRFPVIGDTKDEVLGILLAKDLLPFLIEKNKVLDLLALLRPATVIPESKRLNVLLNDFRTNRNHMAIVIDEYGGVAGLVTIEDVLEQIVGDIEDEHDVEDDTLIRQINTHKYIVKALTPIEEFNETFECHISDEEFDTIGGIVMQELGHMPKRGESATISGFEFKILSADSRRIGMLQVLTPELVSLHTEETDTIQKK